MRTGAFTFVSGVEGAVERAAEAARGKNVQVMGGADVIRQALEAGLVDELTMIIAPVILGAGSGYSKGSRTPSTWSTSACGSRSTRRSSTTRSSGRDSQASEVAGGMIALSRSRLAAGHRTFES